MQEQYALGASAHACKQTTARKVDAPGPMLTCDLARLEYHLPSSTSPKHADQTITMRAHIYVHLFDTCHSQTKKESQLRKSESRKPSRVAIEAVQFSRHISNTAADKHCHTATVGLAWWAQAHL